MGEFACKINSVQNLFFSKSESSPSPFRAGKSKSFGGGHLVLLKRREQVGCNNLATHFCDVTFFCSWDICKTNCKDHVTRNDFKDIFKHVEKIFKPWRAYARAFIVFFSKKLIKKEITNGQIWICVFVFLVNQMKLDLSCYM